MPWSKGGDPSAADQDIPPSQGLAHFSWLELLEYLVDRNVRKDTTDYVSVSVRSSTKGQPTAADWAPAEGWQPPYDTAFSVCFFLFLRNVTV